MLFLGTLDAASPGCVTQHLRARLATHLFKVALAPAFPARKAAYKRSSWQLPRSLEFLLEPKELEQATTAVASLAVLLELS